MSQAYSPQIRDFVFGHSVQGRALQGRQIHAAGIGAVPCILILGGVHADEREGVWIVEHMQALWSQAFAYRHLSVALVPCANPDGWELQTRQNAHGVDLNRNLPTQDWSPVLRNPRYPPGPSAGSEPESQALVGLIQELQPRAILSAHSFHTPQVNSNGPALPWSKAVATASGDPVTEDIGYPTPGSLGTFAGKERQIPTITLEILRGLSQEQVIQKHVGTLSAALNYWEGILRQ